MGVPFFWRYQSMQLLLPMSVVVFLTFAVLVAMVISRIYCVQTNKVKPGYFKTYVNKGNTQIPDYVIKIGRNFTNLTELPPLFYITCLVFMHLGSVDSLTITLAWAFAITRIIHSIIHITINHVLGRLLIFALNCLALLGMWIQLIGKTYL